MNEESTFGGASFQDQNSRSNSSQAYLQRAESAVKEGDVVLGIHLYLAAYERALRENHIPSDAAIAGMSKAWDLALAVKQRSLAEYIFEKLEPFWEADEVARHADELQQLAFDKLEEYGFDRDMVEDMADMVNQDFFDAAGDVLCHFEDTPQSPASQFSNKGFTKGTLANNDKVPSGLSTETLLNESAQALAARIHDAALKGKAQHESSAVADAADDAADGEGVDSAGVRERANNKAGVQPVSSASNAANNTSSDDRAIVDADANQSKALPTNQHKKSGKHEGITASVMQVPPDSPLAAAVAQLSSLAGIAPNQDEAEVAEQHRFDYSNLVGFDLAIEHMAKLGVGRDNDPEFAQFVDMLNKRHGLAGVPGLGTVLFRCAGREDANCFMEATVGELKMPAIRMRLDRNAMGQVVLCVMASPDFKPRLSGVPRAGFDVPTVVVLEDLDTWDLPLFDGADDASGGGMFTIQLSRGAREALALIQAALSSPDVTVLISAENPEDIDPFFWDMIGTHRTVNIELPDETERRRLWRSEQTQHPSLRGLDINQLVCFSNGLSRFEIDAIANEAVEEAYRRSVAANTFCAVDTSDMFMRLSNFQPLDSDEYKRMEDLAVESLRQSFDDLDDLLKG